MIVSEFFARLGVDVDGGSFARAEARLSGLGKTMVGVVGVIAGAFATSQISQWLTGMAAQAAALNDQAQRLGVATTALQEYQLAAELTGTSAQSLQTALQILSKQATNAEGGAKAMAKTFREAGIELSGAEDATALLDRVADAVAATENPIERVAIAQKLLGRSGAELIPLLSEGAEGMARLRAEAEALGGGFTNETIAAADEFDDNLVRMRFSVRSLSAAIGNVLLPIANRIALWLTGAVVKTSALVKQLTAWFKTNKLLQVSLAVLATAGLALVIRSVALWAANVVRLLPLILAWISANRALLASYARLVAVWILSAVAIGAIVLALEDVYQAITGGRSFLVEFLNAWFGLGAADTFIQAWAEGVQSALSGVIDFLQAIISAVTLIPKLIANMAGADFDVAADVKKITGVFDDITAAGKAYANTLAGTDTPVARASRGINGPELGEENIPRTIARGLAAPLVAGSAGFDHISAATAGKVTAATGIGNAAPVQTSTSVEVNVQTGANPREIAREAEKAANRANAAQAARVRAGLAGRKQARGATE